MSNARFIIIAAVLIPTLAGAAPVKVLEADLSLNSMTPGSYCPACYTFAGSVEVQNLSFHKKVSVWYSKGNGQWDSVDGEYAGPTGPGTEQWTFSAQLGYTPDPQVQFAVRYEVGGRVYWDNNNSQDYTITNQSPVWPAVPVRLASVGEPICFWACTDLSVNVRVQNLAYEKQVTIFYSIDGGTWTEAQAAYDQSLPNGFENWRGAIPDVLLANLAQVQFAIRYRVGGQTFWDNNYGTDYTVTTGACAGGDGPCWDGDPCTEADYCADGECHGVAKCDDNDPCTSDSCSGGECTHTPIEGCCAVDSDCDQSDACAPSTCTDGLCVADGAVANCDDGDACTLDSCSAGVCVHEPACCVTDAECDDGDADTEDLCDVAAGTCEYVSLTDALCTFAGNAGDVNACPLRVVRVDENAERPGGLQFDLGWDAALLKIRAIIVTRCFASFGCADVRYCETGSCDASWNSVSLAGGHTIATEPLAEPATWTNGAAKLLMAHFSNPDMPLTDAYLDGHAVFPEDGDEVLLRFEVELLDDVAQGTELTLKNVIVTQANSEALNGTTVFSGMIVAAE